MIKLQISTPIPTTKPVQITASIPTIYNNINLKNCYNNTLFGNLTFNDSIPNIFSQ